MRGNVLEAPRPDDSAAKLAEAAARQIAPGEAVHLDTVVKDQQVTVTDNQLVIAKRGALMRERAEPIPSGAITGVDTQVKDGRTAPVQISVPGRTGGELALQGNDLGPVLAAMVRCLPSHGGAR